MTNSSLQAIYDQVMPNRVLTANVLASLMAIVTPPEKSTVAYKDGLLLVAGRAQFDLTQLTKLINDYLAMPGVPTPQEVS